MVKKVFIICLLVCITACDKIDLTGVISPGSINVEKRFAQSMEWNDAHPPLVLNVPNDDYQFYVCTDIHTEQTTNNLTKVLNLERNNPNAYFTIILGDLVNVKGAMPTFYNALKYNPTTQLKNDTVLVIAGNHDLFNNQWDDYKTYFGTSTYYITVQTPTAKDLLVFLDTGSGTLGTSQLKWLKNLLENQRNNYRNCIVCSHVNLFRANGSYISSGNFTMEETYELCDIFTKNNVNFFLQGHHHKREIFDFNNVNYLLVETLRDDCSDPGFLILTCGQNNFYDFYKLND